MPLTNTSTKSTIVSGIAVPEAATTPTKMLAIGDIISLEGLTRRPLDPHLVDRLAMSIEREGLKNPVDVVPFRDNHIYNGHYKLVAGAHRLAAYKQLGMTVIPARILSRAQAKGWAESENLFRDLTVLDESIAIVKYAKTMKLTIVPDAKGQQPHDKGYSRIAVALGYDRKRVAEAYDHQKLPDDTQERVREMKLDNNRKLLTHLSKLELAAQKKFLDSKQTRSKKIDSEVRDATEFSSGSSTPETPLDIFFACWEQSPIKKLYVKQTEETRRGFWMRLEKEKMEGCA